MIERKKTASMRDGNIIADCAAANCVQVAIFMNGNIASNPQIMSIENGNITADVDIASDSGRICAQKRITQQQSDCAAERAACIPQQSTDSLGKPPYKKTRYGND
ncbi:hypothetical protein [Sphingopyxis sp. DBS4]|uniref:hypothetical protein n=1 Tax=Sphingopyxis sp. DBS4 TaxID=2968500 RepID=UPI00214AB5FB|nr:hypothetical protein [Sphingopyxis sp. DBS4]